MFFFLSKFLPLFVYPIGFVCFLLIFAVIIWKRRRLQTAVLLLAFFTLYLASTPVFSWYFARTLEWQYFPPDPLPEVDVILLLGGGTDSGGFPQPTVNFNSSGDRVLYAAWLYQQGAADAILVTSGRLPGSNESGAARMAAALGLMGVPESAVWLEDTSLNTYENAIYSKPLLEDNDVETILLVTSALHMPRSVAIFEKQGMAVIPAPTDYEVTLATDAEMGRYDQIFSIFAFLPNASSLERTTRTMKEYMGLVIYGWRGWL